MRCDTQDKLEFSAVYFADMNVLVRFPLFTVNIQVALVVYLLG